MQQSMLLRPFELGPIGQPYLVTRSQQRPRWVALSADTYEYSNKVRQPDDGLTLLITAIVGFPLVVSGLTYQ